MRKYAVIGAILVLLALAIALIYYLVEANFHAAGVFWYGAIAGFGNCLFLSSLILTIFLIVTMSTLTKKRSLLFLLLILSAALVTAILWFFKPGDSDVWWYGTIAGFLGCLLLIFLVLIGLLMFKLTCSRPS